MFKILVIILIFTIPISCKKESNNGKEISNSSQTKLNQTINEAQKYFIQKNNKNSSIKSFDVVNNNEYLGDIFLNWKKAFINYDSNGKTNLIVPSVINYLTGEFTQFVYSSNNLKSNGAFVKFIPDSLFFSKSKKAGDIENFTGLVKVYNLNGGLIKTQFFNSGNAVIKNTVKTFSIIGECQTCSLDQATVYSTRKVYYGIKEYTIIMIEFATDNIQNESLLPGSDGGSNFDPASFPIKINNKIVNPCMNKVVEDLLSKNFQVEMIQKLLDPFVSVSGINLNFIEVGEEVSDPGSFDRIGNEFYIYLNNKNMEFESNEFTANNAVHEVAHAFISYAINNQSTYSSTNRHLVMLDNYVSVMYEMMHNYNTQLKDIEIYSLIFTGLSEIIVKNEQFKDEEFKEHFKKAVLDNGLSMNKDDENYYANLSRDFQTGFIGTKCQ